MRLWGRTNLPMLTGVISMMVACGGPGGGGGVIIDTQLVGVGFDMRVVEAPGEASAPPLRPAASAGDLTVTAATVNLRRIDLDLPVGWGCEEYGAAVEQSDPDLLAGRCESDAGGAEVRFEGPFRVDLADRQGDAALPRLAVPPGAYPRVELDMRDVDAEDGPANDPMVGLSLLAFGSYAPGPVTPLTIGLRFEESIRYEAEESAVVVPEGATTAALIAEVPVAVWFEGADAAIEACLSEGDAAIEDGRLVFDERSESSSECDAVEDVLRDNFEAAGRLSPGP